MKKIGTAIANVLLWSYERGSWQYDIMCILIVAFILLMPRTWFQGNLKHTQSLPAVAQQGSLNHDSSGSEQRERSRKLFR